MHADTGPLDNLPINPPRLSRGRCPSCGRVSTFSLGGDQNIPERVAKATGLPQVIKLYHCDNCNSTVSELDIKR